MLKNIVNNGDKLVSIVLMHALTDLVLFLNLGKSMNDIQIQQTVDLIVNEPKFNHLKIEDFKLCFNKIKKGDFGKFYDRIDGQIIFECLDKYCSERVKEAENLSDKWHAHRKNEVVEKQEANPEGQKKVVEVLKSVIENVNVDKKETQKKELSENQKYFNKVLREFDRLYNENPIELNGQRYIDINGVKYSQTEFLEAHDSSE